jgi:hypothetical protein
VGHGHDGDVPEGKRHVLVADAETKHLRVKDFLKKLKLRMGRGHDQAVTELTVIEAV